MVVDRHKLTVFYLKSFGMDSVQVGKAVFVKEITLPWVVHYKVESRHHPLTLRKA